MVRGLVLALCLGTGFVLATPLVLTLTGVLLAASPAVEALMQQYVGIRLLAVPAAFANMVLLGCLFGRESGFNTALEVACGFVFELLTTTKALGKPDIALVQSLHLVADFLSNFKAKSIL